DLKETILSGISGEGSGVLERKITALAVKTARMMNHNLLFKSIRGKVFFIMHYFQAKLIGSQENNIRKNPFFNSEIFYYIGGSAKESFSFCSSAFRNSSRSIIETVSDILLLVVSAIRAPSKV